MVFHSDSETVSEIPTAGKMYTNMYTVHLRETLKWKQFLKHIITRKICTQKL